MKTRSVVLAFGLSTIAIACGGGAAATDPTKAADTAAAADSTATKPAGSSEPATTTTAVALGSGGDLQGTKLTSSSTQTLEADAGVKAPDMGGGSKGGEPGRRPEDLQTIIGSRRDQARACYDAALKTHPGIEGNLDVKFTIDPKGNVTEVSVDEGKSDIHEPSVAACIATVLKGIKFAESSKGFETRAHYPFNFHPKPGPTKKP
jgi:hypothetical protein